MRIQWHYLLIIVIENFGKWSVGMKTGTQVKILRGRYSGQTGGVVRVLEFAEGNLYCVYLGGSTIISCCREDVECVECTAQNL